MQVESDLQKVIATGLLQLMADDSASSVEEKSTCCWRRQDRGPVGLAAMNGRLRNVAVGARDRIYCT